MDGKLCQFCDACHNYDGRKIPATHVYRMVTVKPPNDEVFICVAHANTFRGFAGTTKALRKETG